MSVVVYGDMHLDDSRPWSVKVAQKVIASIVDSPLNNPDNTLVFLGDITERATISGTVYSMLMSLFVNLKYKEVYVLVGNHDGKLNQFNKPVLVYDFLRSKALKERLFSNFRIIDKPTALTLEGQDFLFLPHIFNDGFNSLKDYEKELSTKCNIEVTKKYVAVFGHFTNSFTKVPGELIDVSYLKTDYWCFGHIHNPDTYYQGSYIPNSIAEAGQHRQIRTYTDGVESILPAPYLMDYYSVKYPDPLPEVKAEIPIWTVSNCKDEEVAKDHYGNIFIRRTLYDITMDSDDFDKLNDILSVGEEGVSVEKMFDEFLVATKLTDELKEQAKAYLKVSIKKEN